MKTLAILIYIILPFCIYSQNDIDKAVREAELNICNCTKETLINNGVDVVKLVQITNVYKKTNSIPNSETANVNRLYRQINFNIDNISKGINMCRSKFIDNPKFKPFLSNQVFTSKLEKALDYNNYYFGPKIIKKLATKK